MKTETETLRFLMELIAEARLARVVDARPAKVIDDELWGDPSPES